MDRSTYRTHAEIVSQFETQAQVDAEVRRVLSPLTEADLDAQQRFKRAPFAVGKTNHAHRHSRPACSRCESGMTQCVTPEACECAERPKPAPSAGDLVRVAALFLGLWAAIVLVLLVTGITP